MRTPKFNVGDRVHAFRNKRRNEPVTYEDAFWKFTGTVRYTPDFQLPDSYWLYIIELDPSEEAARFLPESFPHFYEEQLSLMPILDQLAGIE